MVKKIEEPNWNNIYTIPMKQNDKDFKFNKEEYDHVLEHWQDFMVDEPIPKELKVTWAKTHEDYVKLLKYIGKEAKEDLGARGHFIVYDIKNLVCQIIIDLTMEDGCLVLMHELAHLGILVLNIKYRRGFLSLILRENKDLS